MSETPELKIGLVTANVFTSPHDTPDLDPLPPLLAMLAGAKKTIYFAIYSLTLSEVAQAIIDAHNRGVTVQGVADAGTWGGSTSKLPALVQAGVDVRQWGSYYRLMHDKVAVVDGNAVALGSYNWTAQAEKSNVEVLLVCSGAAVKRVLAPALTEQITNTYAQGRVPSVSSTRE